MKKLIMIILIGFGFINFIFAWNTALFKCKTWEIKENCYDWIDSHKFDLWTWEERTLMREFNKDIDNLEITINYYKDWNYNTDIYTYTWFIIWDEIEFRYNDKTLYPWTWYSFNNLNLYRNWQIIDNYSYWSKIVSSIYMRWNWSFLYSTNRNLTNAEIIQYLYNWIYKNFEYFINNSWNILVFILSIMIIILILYYLRLF